MREGQYEVLPSRGAPALGLHESWDAELEVRAGFKRRQHTRPLWEGGGGARSDLHIQES